MQQCEVECKFVSDLFLIINTGAVNRRDCVLVLRGVVEKWTCSLVDGRGGGGGGVDLDLDFKKC